MILLKKEDKKLYRLYWLSKEVYSDSYDEFKKIEKMTSERRRAARNFGHRMPDKYCKIFFNILSKKISKLKESDIQYIYKPLEDVRIYVIDIKTKENDIPDTYVLNLHDKKE